jgi:transposase
MSYMSKYNERIKARQMRRNGISIIVIADKLGVSKSTVSSWCVDIILTEQQYLKLLKNKGVSLTTGQRMGAEANKNKRLNAIKEADIWGKKLIKKISKRELLLIATSLYWSEGSKSDATSGFIFVNSDPEMILIMKMFLTDVINVQLEDIFCSIQINRIHENRIDTVLNFWQKLLHLPKNQFKGPYYINAKVSKIYDNYDNYYGICRLIVKRGMNWKYRMLGLIKALKSEILSG